MSEQPFNQPVGGNDMPRFGGIATMMRLPQAQKAAGLDVAFVGTGTSGLAYRPARQI